MGLGKMVEGCLPEVNIFLYFAFQETLITTVQSTSRYSMTSDVELKVPHDFLKLKKMNSLYLLEAEISGGGT